MSLKKSITTGIAVISLIALTACGEDTATVAPADSAPATEAAVSEEENVGMANPMVEVSSDNAFADELGIAVDTSCLPQPVERFIISGEMAHVAFNVTDTEGNDVKCILRGTFNDEWNENPLELIAGMYLTDTSEPSELTINTTDEDIIFKTVYSDAEKATVSYWDYRSAHFTLSIDGNVSQMTIASLNDAALKAIGAVVTEGDGAYIAPYAVSVDPENIEDAMFYTSIKNINREDGVLSADFTLYSMDLYDAVDITTMEAGDTIYVDGEDIAVTSVEEANPVDFNDEYGARSVIWVNGGIENGGAEFIAYDGGTFRYFGFDDHATFTELGTVRLEVSDDVEFVDSSDPGDNDTFHTADDFENTEGNEADPGFSQFNSEIRVVDNVVVEINRWFIP